VSGYGLFNLALGAMMFLWGRHKAALEPEVKQIPNLKVLGFILFICGLIIIVTGILLA